MYTHTRIPRFAIRRARRGNTTQAKGLQTLLSTLVSGTEDISDAVIDDPSAVLLSSCNPMPSHVVHDEQYLSGVSVHLRIAIVSQASRVRVAF